MARWLHSPHEIGSGWPDDKRRKLSATLSTLGQRAGVAEGMMRAGAGWRDRTSHARNYLKAGVGAEMGAQVSGGFGGLSVRSSGGFMGTAQVSRLVIFLAHGMEYGKWLSTLGGSAMGRRRSMSARDLARPEHAGPLDPIHATAKRIRPTITAAMRGIWRRGGGGSMA